MSSLKDLEATLIKEAGDLLANCKPEEKIDVFKAVSAFFLGLDKQAEKRPLPTNGTGKFSDIRARARAGETEGHA